MQKAPTLSRLLNLLRVLRARAINRAETADYTVVADLKSSPAFSWLALTSSYASVEAETNLSCTFWK